MILSAALQEGFVFLALVAVITSVISGVYYLNIVKLLFFDSHYYKLSLNVINTSNEIKNINTLSPARESRAAPGGLAPGAKNQISLSNSLSITISILTLLILLFILVPDQFLHFSNILSILLFTPYNITI